MSVHYAAEVENVLRDLDGSVHTIEVAVYGELPGCYPARGVIRSVTPAAKQAMIDVAIAAGAKYGASIQTYNTVLYNVSVRNGQDRHTVKFHVIAR